MRKYWTIVGHTFSKHAGNKSFYISTAITILFIVGLINVDAIMSWFQEDDESRVVIVIDDSELELYDQLNEQLTLQGSEMTSEPFNGSESDAIEAVKEGTFDGYLHLGMTPDGLPEGTLHVGNSDDFDLPKDMAQALQAVKEIMALERFGVPAEEQVSISEPVAFQTEMVEEGDGKTEEAHHQTRWLVYALLFVLYFSVMMYGNMIAMEVATEKSSRVMELLISSVSPVTQMFAKITGIALLGLFQFGLLGGASALSVWYRISQSGGEEMSGIIGALGLEHVPLSTMVYVIVFFLLGYLLYATLSATLGCLVSRLEDVNQAVMPVSYLMIMAFLIAMFGLSSPESLIITVTSFIPPFTPMIMFIRVGMTDVAVWQVTLSLLLLIGFIIVCAIFGARVYRGGVMLYGKSGSWKDFRKALVMSKDA